MYKMEIIFSGKNLEKNITTFIFSSQPFLKEKSEIQIKVCLTKLVKNMFYSLYNF